MSTDVSKVRDTLMFIRKLLSEPERWTQGVIARNKNGYRVEPEDSCATSWCLGGAIYLACCTLKFDATTHVSTISYLATHLPTEFENKEMHNYNDSPATTHTDILELLDTTIADIGE